MDNASCGFLVTLRACTLLTTLGAATLGQQVADPTFDARVAHPAYRNHHPRVLFDEAHNNFHKAEGRYKPFVNLMTNDGYEVTPNKARFHSKILGDYHILVVVNALGAPEPTSPKANSSIFTEEECNAVRDWVGRGGSLLLIADHFPAGGAARNFAKHFGVEMSNAYTDDPANHEKQLQTLLFSRRNGLLLDHAITRGRNAGERISKVCTFVGQSLRGPAGSIAFLRLADTAFDELPPDRKKRISAAGRAQGS